MTMPVGWVDPCLPDWMQEGEWVRFEYYEDHIERWRENEPIYRRIAERKAHDERMAPILAHRRLVYAKRVIMRKAQRYVDQL